MDITTLSDEDADSLFYKDEPYSTKKIHQRLIVTYSPKYAAYQKTVRDQQIERAQKMIIRMILPDSFPKHQLLMMVKLQKRTFIQSITRKSKKKKNMMECMQSVQIY